MAETVDVYGRRPLHRVPRRYPLLTACGEPVVANRVRRSVEVKHGRNDTCRACFPGHRTRIIRLGRNQRTIVRRALSGPSHSVYPATRADREAVEALVSRGILVPRLGLPNVYRIASDRIAIHLRGAVLQHRGE